MIPKEMKELNQWVCWRGNKQPYSAITMKPQGWQKKENWTDFKDAIRVAKANKFDGIGFVFAYPYVGIDLDHCIEEDGMMNSLAREIVHSIDTYTEYSKSGKGLHLYCKVTEPIKPLKTADIEIYGENRFFVVTGKALDEGQDEITDQTTAIKALLEKYGKPEAKTFGEIVAQEFVEGERNNRMAAEIGRMFNYWSKDVVFNMAHTLNQTLCKPPLDDDELNKIIDSMSKREVKQIPPKAMKQEAGEHIEGRRDLDELPYRGIAKPRGVYIPTGLTSIDYAINDLAPGCTTLITGRSNAGKSAFVKQIMANAVSRGYKVYAVHGEGEQELSINALYECVIGREKEYFDFIKLNKRWHKEPKQYVLNALKRWHKDKLVLFSKGESKFKTTTELFEQFEYEVKHKGAQLVVLDNLMSILTAKATEKNEAQADFMQRCHDLADVYKIHIILVLHPNKEYRKNDTLDMEQISGSSDLYNKADNILSVIREYRDDEIAKGINGHIDLIKNRYYPDLVKCDTYFDKDTGLLLELKEGQAISYDFDWKRFIDATEAPIGFTKEFSIDELNFEGCPF